MNTLLIKTPIAVLTDRDSTLVITELPTDIVEDNRIPVIENSLIVKDYFKDLQPGKPLFCHIFPAASVISFDLLRDTEELIDKAIQFKPD